MACVTAPVPGSTWVPAWTATVSIRISDTSPDLLPSGIVQRLAAHGRGDRVAEKVDRQARLRRGRADGEVGVGDRCAEGVAGAAARRAADRAALGQEVRRGADEGG